MSIQSTIRAPLSSDRNETTDECVICYEKIINKAFVNDCLHSFCYTCIIEWTKVKAVCPLCVQPINELIKNVRSMDDYDIQHIEAPVDNNLIDFGSDVDWNIDINSLDGYDSEFDQSDIVDDDFSRDDYSFGDSVNEEDVIMNPDDTEEDNYEGVEEDNYEDIEEDNYEDIEEDNYANIEDDNYVVEEDNYANIEEDNYDEIHDYSLLGFSQDSTEASMNYHSADDVDSFNNTSASENESDSEGNLNDNYHTSSPLCSDNDSDDVDINIGTYSYSEGSSQNSLNNIDSDTDTNDETGNSYDDYSYSPSSSDGDISNSANSYSDSEDGYSD